MKIKSSKFILLSFSLFIISCTSDFYESYLDYNFVEIKNITVRQFPQLNSINGPWDELSYPDFYSVVREENEDPKFTITQNEVHEYDMPISLNFSEPFKTAYFYRDLVIFLYDNDVFEDDFIGRTDTFRFADAIENQVYNPTLEIEGDEILIELSLKWSY